MINLEVVTHAYDPPGLSVYSSALRIQASSLIYASGPPVCVKLSICYTTENASVVRAVAEILRESRGRRWFSVHLEALPPSRLFRRAIGRNLLAKSTKADVVWFTDADYLVAGPETLKAMSLVAGMTEEALFCPSEIEISRWHDAGAAVIAAANAAPLVPRIEVPDEHFARRRQRIAIGGVQIVKGDTARHGYLDRTQWCESVDPKLGFRSCRCDRAYRSWLGLKTVRVPIPGIRRLRHTEDGRDYDAAGRHRGKEAW